MNSLYLCGDVVLRVGAATAPAVLSHRLVSWLLSCGVPTLHPVEGLAADVDGLACDRVGVRAGDAPSRRLGGDRCSGSARAFPTGRRGTGGLSGPQPGRVPVVGLRLDARRRAGRHRPCRVRRARRGGRAAPTLGRRHRRGTGVVPRRRTSRERADLGPRCLAGRLGSALLRQSCVGPCHAHDVRRAVGRYGRRVPQVRGGLRGVARRRRSHLVARRAAQRRSDADAGARRARRRGGQGRSRATTALLAGRPRCAGCGVPSDPVSWRRSHRVQPCPSGTSRGSSWCSEPRSSSASRWAGCRA